MTKTEAHTIAGALAQARASVFMSDQLAIVDNTIRKVALAVEDMTGMDTAEFCRRACTAPTYEPPRSDAGAGKMDIANLLFSVTELRTALDPVRFPLGDIEQVQTQRDARLEAANEALDLAMAKCRRLLD